MCDLPKQVSQETSFEFNRQRPWVVTVHSTSFGNQHFVEVCPIIVLGEVLTLTPHVTAQSQLPRYCSLWPYPLGHLKALGLHDFVPFGFNPNNASTIESYICSYMTSNFPLPFRCHLPKASFPLNPCRVQPPTIHGLSQL